MTRRMTYILAVLAAAVVLAVPAVASARLASNPPTGTAQPSPVVVQAAAGGGFHWGDAGIGAAVVLALTALGAAATMTTRRRALVS